MALGGGTFTVQNKKLPGSYINFVSTDSADPSLSDRGIVTMGLELNWGASDVITVSKEDAIKNSFKIFGYNYTDDEMQDIRDIFAHAVTLLAYRLNGGGVKASCTYGEALYAGTRGNALKLIIAKNVDDNTKYDVSTYLNNVLVDTQTVASASALVDNDYVAFNKTATLAETAGTAFTGGTNSTVTGTQHTAYLAALESYSFNAIGVKSSDSTVIQLYTAFTQRMRDEVGVKFQCIVYNYPDADYEGVISVANSVDVIPWVLGAEGGCAVNKSCTNMLYDGEANVSSVINYTQSALEAFIDAGQLVLHRVGENARILTDINTLTTTTDTKGDIFKQNQSIRVIDQIANDIAVLFNEKYIGNIANNASGRISLWSDIVKHHKQLATIGAIEDFSESDVVVEAGEASRAVVVTDLVTIVNAMEQLYMTVTVQ